MVYFKTREGRIADLVGEFNKLTNAVGASDEEVVDACWTYIISIFVYRIAEKDLSVDEARRELHRLCAEMVTAFEKRIRREP